jgi:4-hydroxybenzoate polyprenyltransferase
MSFFRLIRSINLIFIALTMAGVWISQTKNTIPAIEFVLFVVFTLLIAGAGNAINDYFDVRSDRINKPEKIVLEKTIKRRWAIIIHWVFNAIALVLSLYLSWRFKSWFYVFIHFFTTYLLWTYSVNLKRRLFWSNLSIALLVGIIPIIALKPIYDLGLQPNNLGPVLLFSLFAFLLNFSREIIKDIQDMEGDSLRNVRSFPIVYGRNKARWIATSISLLIVPIYLTGSLLDAFPTRASFNIFFNGAVCLGASILLFQLFHIQEKHITRLLKLSLFFGAIALYFI